ncbi:threonine-phosphate decarboxylase [uncultured Sulfitobacter sp.]|uniref:threonine-phosphate decarboxylase n=1 Tax=uncultured Sulfitobacter sp. TaxID=191468 RepID=UPI00261F1822|nr:threonine-phosphate decarboxylase [uncultured Sulfitobacter sp.]
MGKNLRDHGGGIDEAAEKFGGLRSQWVDLSTGINPIAYKLGTFTDDAWTALPDRVATSALLDAARQFWKVPKGAAILATPGASASIAMIPRLRPTATVHIATPTYNEHAAAFAAAGWNQTDTPQKAAAQVIVHPNNPDGRIFDASDLHAPLRIIDESFADVIPNASLIAEAATPNTVVLKSFGKFWGLAGLRLGFAIGDPELINQLATMLGPWPVAGPALQIGARALSDHDWADQTRERLLTDTTRIDSLLTNAGAKPIGGTTLFRLYEVDDAAKWQDRLASRHIWSRVFPYNSRWLRLGLPAPDQWSRLEKALA